MKKLFTILSLVGLLITSGFSQTVPSWRGQPNTLMAYWDFSTNTTPIVPEQYSSTFTAPYATTKCGVWGLCYLYNSVGPYPMTILGTSNVCFWDLGSNGVANCVVYGPTTGVTSWKEQVQVIYYYDGGTYSKSPIVTVPGAKLISTDFQTLTINVLGGQWRLMTCIFTATNHCRTTYVQSPTTGLLLDRVVVDTQANVAPPEPALPPLQLYFPGEDGQKYFLLSTTDMKYWTTNFTFVGIMSMPIPVLFSSETPRAYRIVRAPK